MPNNYRYQLETTGKKHLCPGCGKKTFVRYIDNESKQYLPEQYGRCDRESNCQYHQKPDKAPTSDNKPMPKAKPQPVYYMPESVLNATLNLKDYDKNTFVQNLLKIAPVADVQKVIELYRIGTVAEMYERAGACCFPFIDKAGNVRAIQAKQFNETNHTTSTDFVHSILNRYFLKQGEALPGWLNDYSKNDLKVSCLFGEQLLKLYPLNPVALVEAPKTAIIGALYYGLPETPNALLWLGVYNKSSLTLEKCKALQGRKIVLYPDLNAYNLWNAQAQEYSAKISGTKFIVSDLLERIAAPAEIISGLDLADYLTRFDISRFRGEGEHITPPQEETPPQPSNYSHSEPPAPEPIQETAPRLMVKSVKSDKSESETKPFFCGIEKQASLYDTQLPDWSEEIEQLTTFFNETQLPEAPVKLSEGLTITNVKRFIDTHLTAVRANNGKPFAIQHLYRLRTFKKLQTD